MTGLTDAQRGITDDSSSFLTNYGAFQGSEPRGIVIHSLECGAIPGIAAQLSSRGGWLDGEGLAPTLMTDPTSIVRAIPDGDSGGHIGGPGNSRYLGVEVSGRAAWTRAQWLDGGPAQAALEHQARAVAGLFVLYGRPFTDIRWLSIAQLRAGTPFGMCFHADISISGVSGTDHWDPGLGYPGGYVLAAVQRWFLSMTGGKPVPPPGAATWLESLMGWHQGVTGGTP